MASTNFPNGFLGDLVVRNMPLLTAYPGKVFWVDSNAVSSARGTFARPFTTIADAVSSCTAGKGDIIVCKAGHTETITGAAGIALSTSSVALVGLGTGSTRPTLSFTTAVGASFSMSAANCVVYNFLFAGNIDALTGPISVTAADCALYNCEWRDVGSTQATDVIVATAAATRFLVDGYFHNGHPSAGANSAIALTGITNPVIRNFRIVGNFAVSAIDIRTTACVDVSIHDGYIWTKNSADLCVKDTVTGSTGRVGPNLHLMLTDNAANITEACTGATFHYFQPINVCNLAGEVGMQTNITASTDA